MAKEQIKTSEAREPVSRLSQVRSGQFDRGMDRGSLQLPELGRVSVSIGDIVPDERNERKVFRGIEELAETIREVGIIEPPTAVRLPDGRYKLTTGHRRWQAAKLAGKKRIDIIVTEPEDESKRRVKSLISNIQREDLGAVELTRALSEMKTEHPGVKTNRDLAKLIGKSEQWVGQMLKILDLPAPVMAEVEQAKVSIPYDAVIEIARLKDEAAQRSLLQSAIKGATVRQIREQARGAGEQVEAKADRPAEGKFGAQERLSISQGEVVIRLHEKEPTKDDLLEALAAAMKAVKARE